MASAYARIEIITARPGSSAVGHALYACALAGVNSVTGVAYDYRRHAADRVARGIAWPPAVRECLRSNHDRLAPYILDAAQAADLAGSPERDEALGPAIAALWSASERLDVGKRSGRFRHRAQLARSGVVALPVEYDAATRERLLLDWIDAAFARDGLLVTWAIRAPRPDSPDNHHALLAISTRLLDPQGFDPRKERAKAVGPIFASGRLAQSRPAGDSWLDFQLQFAASNHIPLDFAPPRIDTTRDPRWLSERRRTA